MEQRLGLEHHAGTAAVGIVVHGMMTVAGVVTEVVQIDAEQAALHGTTQNAVLQRPLEHLGKEREDVDSHSG